MQYINPQTNTVYSGDRAHWTHIPVTSEQPSPYHVPVIEDGEHTGLSKGITDKNTVGVRFDNPEDNRIISCYDYGYSSVYQVLPAEVIIIAKRSF